MSLAIILESALHWSGALRRKIGANALFENWLSEAAAQPVTRKTIQTWFDELKPDNIDTALPVVDVRRVLRQLRERVFFTLMVRDINGAAPLQEVVTAMSSLADLAIAQAYQSVAASLAEVHGAPLDPNTGKPQEMIILGMGKLGGKELNVSSDIDLIMLYGEEGETTGRRKISHHEFYGRVTQRMMPVLSEVDADGQVFRTDLRLRPDGDSGPLAWSLDALESYLVTQGREWERYAWLKSRVIPCKAFADSDPANQLEQVESLRTPFVYRKYFDFDALAALRGLRERIRQDWQRRALARTGVDT
ncbi:MAG TPA: bifunctional glutamine synthetase adenylyltransferase/deadenyltransferase, partial [Candidimonas sp.]|nr:bifunctional glutamine synthetase adenylyltransferase/deadenyltransferase [Candidimonas sp.]